MYSFVFHPLQNLFTKNSYRPGRSLCCCCIQFCFSLSCVSLTGFLFGSAMFFHIVLERNMQLHPRHFGRDLREKLVSKLMKDVEGTCRWNPNSYLVFAFLCFNLGLNNRLWGFYSGRHGFIVAITGIESVGKGIIRDGTGFVTFPVKYQCVVFRPFKGEILEAVVTMVNKVSFFFIALKLVMIQWVGGEGNWCRWIE